MGKSRRLFIIGVESIRCGRKSTDLTKCSGGCPSFYSPGLMASVFVDRETRPLVILLQTHPWLYECTSYRGGGDSHRRSYPHTGGCLSFFQRAASPKPPPDD